MAHVYISYSSDEQDKALALKGQLKEKGIEAFVDSGLASDGYAINAGQAWREELRAKIDECFAVVLVCTRASMQSLEVCFEWSYAMGRGVIVIPLIYEADCTLHSRLEVLQKLDFSNPRKRQWDTLVALLEKTQDSYKKSSRVLQKVAGISDIFYSRQELCRKYSISSILGQVEEGSELVVVARTCEAWARDYLELQNALNTKHLLIKLSMVDPAIPGTDWMICGEYGILDAQAIAEKLKRIRFWPTSKGSLQLYYLPSSPLLSFVCFTAGDGTKVGILEIGADLGLNDRAGIIFQSKDSTEVALLNTLCKVHSKVFEKRQPVLVCNANKPRAEG